MALLNASRYGASGAGSRRILHCFTVPLKVFHYVFLVAFVFALAVVGERGRQRQVNQDRQVLCPRYAHWVLHAAGDKAEVTAVSEQLCARLCENPTPVHVI